MAGLRVLVTGNVGFIGAHFAAFVLREDPAAHVVGFARKGDERNELRRRMIDDSEHWRRFQQVWGDLTDRKALSGVCEGVDVVVNFAAKTFVDHSLKDPHPFIQSNVIGADALMEDATRHDVRCFVQVSTDEVYGEILEGRYREDAPLNPRNPYAWTKACADLDAVWRHRTYGFPAIVTRTENNFGPWQHRQKAIPTFVRKALAGEPLPVYGDGMHVRCWLHVEDHCRAIWHLVRLGLGIQEPAGIVLPRDVSAAEIEAIREDWRSRGRGLPILPGGASVVRLDPGPVFGEVFHVAGERELTNLELANFVLRTLELDGRIEHVEDRDVRPGHDRRYALDVSKLRATGWEPHRDLFPALAETVRWYADNPWWAA